MVQQTAQSVLLLSPLLRLKLIMNSAGISAWTSRSAISRSFILIIALCGSECLEKSSLTFSGPKASETRLNASCAAFSVRSVTLGASSLSLSILSSRLLSIILLRRSEPWRQSWCFLISRWTYAFQGKANCLRKKSPSGVVKENVPYLDIPIHCRVSG